MKAPLILIACTLACASPHPTPAPAPAAPRLTMPPPISVTLPDPPTPGPRLPGDVVPVKYALDLTLVPDGPRAHGTQHVAARVVRDARVVWLHALGLTIDRATIAGAPARVIPEHDGIVGLVAATPLVAGHEVAIDVGFSAPIDRQRALGIYSEEEHGERYAYTFFEPIDARRAFPCFDEPAYKVPWQLTFHVKAAHHALGNAPVVRETPEADGMKKVELAESKPLPSYLVAFIVGPFELVDGGTGGRAHTPIRFAIPQGRAGELGYAKQITPKVVAALEDYFDMDYPYGKLDVAVVPRFWGTMEHPGLVAMGQPLTLIRPDQDTRSRRYRYANILAHELAHYWFGDVVTMAWWDDTWLNEALGEWLDLIITDVVEPTWRARDGRVGLAGEAMEADEALATHPIRRAVTTNEEIAASFDNDITYAKGATVLRMFEAYVGVDKWRAFMRAHIRAHAWGNASADDFLALAKRELGADVEAGLRDFVETPGVPRITARARCDAKTRTLALDQVRALPVGTATTEAARPWHVPVCLRYGDAKGAHATCTLMSAAHADVPVEGGCPTWIVPNAGANAYYRATPDLATTTQLLTAGSPIAKVAKPTPAERMALIMDLRASLERGEPEAGGTAQLLALVPVIARDPDDKVALEALAAAALRTDAFDDALDAKAKRFYAAAFGPRARELGWARKPADTDERHDLRRAFVPMVAARDPKLGAEAERLADAWVATKSGVADDLVPSVLAAAMYRGDAARFERVLAARAGARDRAELARLYQALGSTKDPKLAQRALELLLAKDVDLRDALGIMYGVLGHRETRAIGLAFVAAHIDELLARMRDDEASWFLAALAGNACEPGLRGELAKLVTPRAAKYDGAQAFVVRGLEQADRCIASLARQRPAIEKFLAKY